MMDEEEVGSVIITDDGELVGIVTDRQVALAFADEDPSSLTAGDVMTEDPVTLSPDDEDIEIARTMGENKIRRIPVVEDGELHGIVTLDDVVATIGEQMCEVADVIEAQSPDYSP